MTWIVRWGGERVTSDDFTLDDLIALEKETGTPWSALNPLREIRIARAFLRVAINRTGGDPDDADRATLGRLKHVFEFEEDQPWPGGGEGSDDDGPLDLKARGSSPGASAGSTGGRAKRGESV